MAGIFGSGRIENEDNAESIVRAVDTSALHDAVLAAVRRGWLLGFGRGRDGYAASVSVLDSGERSVAWCETTEQLDSALRRVVEAATDLDRQPEEALPSKPAGAKVAKRRRAH